MEEQQQLLSRMEQEDKKLITDTTSDQESQKDKEDETRKRFGCLPQWYLNELWEVFNFAWVTVLIAVTNSLMTPIGLIFIGREGTIYLDGVGLATTILNLTGIMIFIGMGTASDTLFSQAYGSGNKKKVGVFLQRSLTVLLLVTLSSWAFLLNTESFLILLGQNPGVARIAGRYTLIYMLCLPVIYFTNIKYLRSQNIIKPLTIFAASGSLSNILLQFIFVSKLQMGVEGSALASTLSYMIQAGSLLSYILISKLYVLTWGGWTLELFQDWGPYFKIAIAGMLMVSLPYIQFEIGTLLIGTLGKVQLAAQAIVFQVETITYMIPTGIGIGCSIRVGQLLGANNALQVRRTVMAGYSISLMTSCVVMTLILSLRTYIPRIFSNDGDAIEIAENILPILALYNINNSTGAVSSGVLRGCGRQIIGAIVIFIMTYLIGLPAGISLMFYTKLKAAGFWWGVTIALFLEGVTYLIIVYNIDWEKQARNAQILTGVFPSKTGEKALKEYGGKGTEQMDEKLAILENANGHLPHSTSKTKLYNSETTRIHEEKAKERPGELTISQLFIRRGLFVLVLLCLLGFGIFARLYFTPRLRCLSSLPGNRTLLNWTALTSTNYTMSLCQS